jgi:gliding motility-associated-like protein
VSQAPELIFTQVELIQPRCFGEANGQLLIVAGGGTSSYLYSLNGSVPDTTTLFTNLISASYSINIIDASGCLLDTILFLNQAAPLQISSLEINPISCEQASNGKISISGIGGNGILSYTLLPGGVTNQSGNFTNLAFGIYTIGISDSVGCNIDTIVAIPLPENPMRIITRKQDLGCSGTGTEGWAEVGIEGGEGPYQISWNTSPPQFTSKIDNLTYGYYAVHVTDANGCQDKDTVYIKPGECCEQIFIPNAFSPNNDGLNDVFRIYTTAAIELLQYAVYDRWGNKVWSTFNHLDSWDGQFNNGKTDIGTYFYIFRYTCLTDGKTYLRSGDITILR